MTRFSTWVRQLFCIHQNRMWVTVPVSDLATKTTGGCRDCGKPLPQGCERCGR